MTNVIGVVAGTVLCVAVAAAPSKTDSDREVRDLVKRVEKLEQSAQETSGKLDKMTKAVADLEKAINTGRQNDGKARDPVARTESNEKRIKDIEKDMEQVNRFMADMQKQVGTQGQDVAEFFKKRDARIKQLSEWFDDYHPRKDMIHYHRDKCEGAR